MLELPSIKRTIQTLRTKSNHWEYLYPILSLFPRNVLVLAGFRGPREEEDPLSQAPGLGGGQVVSEQHGSQCVLHHQRDPQLLEQPAGG